MAASQLALGVGNDTWTGGSGSSDNWSDSANWLPGSDNAPPLAYDTLLFDGNTRTSPNNDFTADTPFDGIYFNSGAGAFALSGNSILLSGQIYGNITGITNNSSSAQTVNLDLSLDWGLYTFVGGSGGLALDGTMTPNAGALAYLGGNLTSSSMTTDSSGLISGLGGAGIRINGDGNFYGLATVNSGAIVDYVYDPGNIYSTATTITSGSDNNVELTQTANTAYTIGSGASLNTVLTPNGGATATLNISDTLTMGIIGGFYVSDGITSSGGSPNTSKNLITLNGGNVSAGGSTPGTAGTLIFAVNGNSTGNQLACKSTVVDNGGGAVTVIKTGGGSMYYNNGNSYSGGTYIDQGYLQGNQATSYGTGPVYVAPGATAFPNNNGGTFANDFYLPPGHGAYGYGTLRLSQNYTFSGKITFLGAPVAIAPGCQIGQTSGGKTATFTGQFTGTGTAELLGAANPTTIILNNSSVNTNNWTGGLIVDQSGNNSITVQEGSDFQVNSNNVTLSQGGTGITLFDLNGHTDVFGGLSANSSPNIQLKNNGGGTPTLTLGAGDADGNFGGAISGSLNLVKIGAGTQILSNTNAYTGDTTISQGKLEISSDTASTGNYSVADAAALGVDLASAGSQLSINSLTLGSSGTSTLQINTETFGNPSVAPLNVTTLNLNGTVNIQLSGATLAAGSNIPLIDYGSESGSGTITLITSPRISATVNDDHAGHITVTINSADATIEWLGGVDGNWDVNDTGNLVWQGLTSHSPTYYIESGGAGDVVQFDDNVTGTTTVNLTTNLAPSLLTVTNVTKDYTFSGTGKITGSTGLTKDGSGSLTLTESGGDDFSGPVAVNAGTLTLDNPNNAASGGITVAGGATLQVGNNDANGAFPGNVTDNGSLIFNRSDDALAPAGVISGSGDVFQNGPGTVTLNVVEAYTGLTTVNGGILVLNGGNNANSTITSSSGLVINTNGIVKVGIDNSLLGHGTARPVTINAGGLLTGLEGDDGGAGTSSHVTGLLTFNGGRLSNSGTSINNKYGSWDLDGGVAVNSGPNYAATSIIDCLSVVPDQGGGTIFDVANGSTPSGVDLLVTGTLINGTSQHDTGIIKNGNGTMALDNDNTYAAGTTINAGILQLGASTDSGPLTTPLGAGFVVNDATLQFSSSQSVTVDNVISGTGKVVVNNGTAILTTNESYSGNTTVSGATLQLTGSGSISSSPTVSIDNGTLAISVANNSSSTVNFNNGTLQLSKLTVSGNLSASAVNFSGSTNVIQVDSVPRQIGFPSVYPLINCSSVSGFSTLGVTLPSTFEGYLSNDVANSQTIYLVLTNGPFTALISWNGNVDGTWDNNAVNDWLTLSSDPTNYNDGDVVRFDDNASTKTVTIQNPVSPGDTYVSNTVTYTFIGSGGISGTNSLTKQGAGTLLLDNSGANDFSGGMNISAGTVQVGNADANGGIGTGSVANNGSLVFDRSDNIAVNNAINGSGGVTQESGAALTLSGANTFGGTALVTGNSLLQAGSDSALGSAVGGTTVEPGSSLDVNGHNLGAEAVTAGGTGTDAGAANGAIYNSSGTAGALANVTLSADTTIGGSGNWNLSGGTFSTGGNAYNLTKAGANQIGLVGESVDAALGDVDVQSGTLSVETTTGLGNTASNLYVRSGATLQFNNLANPLNKQIQLDAGATIYTAGGNNNTVSGPVTLGGDATIDGAGASVLTLNNALGGSANLYKNGTNTTLVLDESDSSAVNIQINNGTLILNGDRSNTGTILYTVDGTTSLGGNGTNAGAIYIGGLLEPGLNGTPGTLGAGTLGIGTYGGTPKVVFNLGSSTTVGGGVNDLLNVTGNFDPGANNIIIRPLGLLSTAGNYTLAKYGGIFGTPFNSNVQLDPAFGPARYQFSLTQGSGSVQLTVTTGAGQLEWNDATGNGIWDVTNTFNWYNTVGATNDYFAPLDTVTFDDSIIASGATNVVSIVAGGVTPSVVTVDSTTNYVIEGPGAISGFASIVKSGSSTLTLSGANDFTGTVTVSGGTLLAANNSALGSTDGATIVTNGGTLDIGATVDNTIYLGAEPLYISGWGVNSNGALVNDSDSGSYPGGNGNIVNVTLQGDAAIGGTGRMDMRAAGATLSTGGHPYKLVIKNTNANGFNMVDVNVDPALGDVDIAAGLCGIQGDMGMGDVESNLTIFSGATFQLYSLTATNGLAKSLVLQDGAFLHNAHGANLVSGPVTLSTNSLGGAGACYFTIGSSGLTVSGVIGGAGSLVKTNGGSALTLTTNNTYTGDTVIAQGTLTLTGNATIDESPNIILNGGAMDVSGRDDGTLTLSADSFQTLSGAGTLTGILSSPANTTVAPGDDATIGTLTVSGDAGLAGTTVMKLDAGAVTSDEVDAGGDVTYGGTLILTNISATPLAAGQSFKIFNGATYTGSFTIEPATPGAGLAWNTSSLTSDGTISVISTSAPTPVVTGISISGTSLTITATNGSPDGTYYLLESTNVSLPLSQWTPVLTNQYDGSGNVNVSTNIVNPADTQVFYILSDTNNQ